MCNKLYWKLLIGLPESSDSIEVCTWIKAKFQRGTVPNAEIPNKVTSKDVMLNGLLKKMQS